MSQKTPLRDLGPAWMENGEGKYALLFECPACEGSHAIAVPFRDCEDARDLTKKGAIWRLVSGSTFEDLTFHPSINMDLGRGCSFHGWVKEGQVTW